MSLKQFLKSIENKESAPSLSPLFELSNLMDSEIEDFFVSWVNIPTIHKHRVMQGILELSHERAELDFSDLLVRCLDDEDSIVRQKAIEGLWECEDRSLVRTLCQILSQDSSADVRAAAAQGLGRFAFLSQEGKLLEKDCERVSQSLLETLQDEKVDLHVRRRCLEAAAILNTSEIVKYIEWAYKSDNLDLKCSSLYAMGKTGESDWLPALMDELESPLPALRYEAANACAELEEESAVPHLIPIIDDDDLQVQLSAIRAIGAIGGPLAKKTLRRYLRSGDPVIEEAAQDSLDMIDTMEDPISFKSFKYRS